MIFQTSNQSCPFPISKLQYILDNLTGSWHGNDVTCICWNGLVQQKTISSVSTMGANWVEAVIVSESEARDSWAQYSLESVQLGIA
ncbi:BQ5605_C051g12549 [Microbotryum silenes-dioicae]|uniref:BQ5605_C051g12549 protein n=1 Tax=Microbotryum silenes-dioicae TaxID=796604 RepID=A0A2X0NAE1_9BASI|nr:BQ5605_C051g12549 [Microbotryum silenes-dioicae]